MKYRYFFLAFAVAFLILALLFFLLMSFVHPSEVALPEPEPVAEDAVAYLPGRDEALTVLFVGVSADAREANTFLLARFDPARGAVPIVTFPGETVVRNGQGAETLAEVFRYGGAEYTRRALADTLGIRVDRYVRMDRQTFLIAATTVGSVEFDLPAPVSLGEGSTAMVLSPGIQLLDAQKAAGILSYEGHEGGALARCTMVSELAAATVNQRMDIALSTVVDKVFEKIVNLVETDISYADYDDRKEAAKFLARLGNDPARAIPVAGAFEEDGERYVLSDTFVALMTQTFS